MAHSVPAAACPTPVATLCTYVDTDGQQVGVSVLHEACGAVVDVLHMATVPSAYVGVHTPTYNHRGSPHVMEHVLLGKGSTGRAVAALCDRLLVASSAHTSRLHTAYHWSCPTATLPGFVRILRQRLHALLRPDCSDEEVRREVCHMAPTADGGVEEKGTVYAEMVGAFAGSGNQWLFHHAHRAAYGPDSPLGYEAGGTPDGIRAFTCDDFRAFHARRYALQHTAVLLVVPFDVSATVAAVADLLAALPGVGRSPQPPPPDPDARHPPPWLQAHPVAGRDCTMLADCLPPPPSPPVHPPGHVAVVPFADAGSSKASTVLMVWPGHAGACTTNLHRFRLAVLLHSFASGCTSVMHRVVVGAAGDAPHALFHLGASGVSSWADDSVGQAVYVCLSDVTRGQVTDHALTQVRDSVVHHLRRVADMAPGSADLAAFNADAASYLDTWERSSRLFVASPPGFGKRGTYDAWFEMLRELRRGAYMDAAATPRRDGPHHPPALELSGAADFAAFRRVLATSDAAGVNPWAAVIRDACLLSPDRPPFVLASKGSADVAAAEQAAAGARVGAFVAAHPMDAFKSAFDAATAVIDGATAVDASASGGAATPDESVLPMSLDPTLPWQTDTLHASGRPLCVTTLPTAALCTVGLAFPLRPAVTHDVDLTLVASLPALLLSVGFVIDGCVVPHREALKRQRQEILSVSAYPSYSATSGRCEVVVRGCGTTIGEGVRALNWVEAVLRCQPWTLDTLPRIREVVRADLAACPSALDGRAEHWATSVLTGVRHGDDAVGMACTNQFARHHRRARLHWLLAEPPRAPAYAAADAVTRLLLGSSSGVTDGPADVCTRLHTIGTAVQQLATGSWPRSARAGRPMRRAVADLPRHCRPAVAELVWTLRPLLSGVASHRQRSVLRLLTRQLVYDWTQPPVRTLRAMRRFRRRLFANVPPGPRGFAVANAAMLRVLVPELHRVVGRLRTAPWTSPPRRPVTLYAAAGVVAARRSAASAPVAVQIPRDDCGVVQLSGPCACVAPSASTPSSVSPSSAGSSRAAAAATADGVSEAELLDFATYMLLAGSGPRSLFSRTWAAGLAYSSGLSPSAVVGRVQWYADHVKQPADVLAFAQQCVSEFVADGVRQLDWRATRWDVLSAVCCAGFRGGDDFGVRGETMARDLVDGVTPDSAVVLGSPAQLQNFKSSLPPTAAVVDVDTAHFWLLPPASWHPSDVVPKRDGVVCTTARRLIVVAVTAAMAWAGGHWSHT